MTSDRVGPRPGTAADPPGLPLADLEAHIRQALPGMLQGSLSAELLAGGRSNLTYLLTDDENRWVLRRPPLGHVLETAHDMGREHRVLAALSPTDVPVPRPLLLADAEVIGAPFYLMTFAEGQVMRDRWQLERLAERLPVSPTAAIVHGDYRLDNVVVDPGEGHVVAVLDWEMATLGDPLADVASTVVWWDGMRGLDSPAAAVPGDVPGYPGSDRILEAYGRGSSLDLAWLPLPRVRVPQDRRHLQGNPFPVPAGPDHRRGFRAPRRRGASTRRPGSRRPERPHRIRCPRRWTPVFDGPSSAHGGPR